MLGQQFEATVETLADKAEFPYPVAAVALAKDQRGFAAATTVDRTLQPGLSVDLDRERQAAELRQRQCRREGNSDALDRRRLRRQIDGQR